MSETTTPRTVSDLHRRIHAGDCFRSDFRHYTLFFFFVETVGAVCHLVDASGDEHTGPAGDDQLKAAISNGIEPIERDEIP